MSELKPVTAIEAEELISTGEWFDDDDGVEQFFKPSYRKIPQNQWDEITKIFGCLDESGLKGELFRNQIFSIRNLIRGSFSKHFEYCQIIQDPIDYKKIRPEIRVKKGKVFRIQKASQDIAAGVTSIAAAVFSPAYTLMIIAGGGAQIYDAISKVIDNYVSLDDPIQRDAFESIWRLSGRAKVIDYDALAQKQYSAAYANDFPTMDEVLNDLHGKHAEDMIVTAINYLIKEKIISKKNDELRVAF